MSEKTYRIIELVGTSTDSVEDAITNGIASAANDGIDLDWFEVVQIRGHVADQKVAHYQVHLKVGHR